MHAVILLVGKENDMKETYVYLFIYIKLQIYLAH